MNNVTCPYCNETASRKAGFYADGSQKYLCKSCGKKHNGHTAIIRDPEQYLTCPYCNSTHTKKGGHLSSGTQRFICKSCNRYFSEKTVIKQPITATCPDCKSHNLRRTGFNKLGIQRYVCKDCGRKFVEEVTVRPKSSHQVVCPKCNHHYAKKGGQTGNKSQYWICLQCGHKYLEDPRYKHVTDEQKREIVSLMNCGYTPREIGDKIGKTGRTIKSILESINPAFKDRVCRNIALKRERLKQVTVARKQRQQQLEQEQKEKRLQEQKREIVKMYTQEGLTKKQIATKLHIAVNTVNIATDGLMSKDEHQKFMIRKLIMSGKNPDKVCAEYNYNKSNIYKLMERDYRNEVITPQQTDLIIKFGVMLDVPVEYLAEYVPCSEKKCKEVMKQYSHLKVPRKKILPTEQELALDKIALEKFVGH